jgi:peptidoglycan hydrolase-like protein with peptidoglycan-binding domain
LLRNAGYFPIASTGYFGEITQAALKDFQAAKGLAMDGIAGDQTFKALAASLSATPAIAPTPAVTTPVVTAPVVSRPGTVSSVDLGFGDSGASVMRLQNLLRRAGYFRGLSTGYYGVATREAVTRFQQASQIPADGFAGLGTIAALESAPAAPNTVPPTRPVATNIISTNSVNITAPVSPVAIARVLQLGDSGAEVQALQQRLTALRYYSGPITGIYGELTTAAVESFQRAKNLEIDGVFGAKSYAALR